MKRKHIIVPLFYSDDRLLFKDPVGNHIKIHVLGDTLNILGVIYSEIVTSTLPNRYLMLIIEVDDMPYTDVFDFSQVPKLSKYVSVELVISPDIFSHDNDEYVESLVVDGRVYHIFTIKSKK